MSSTLRGWKRIAEAVVTTTFVVACNPDERSRLPYLLWLPVEDGLALKAKASWPQDRRVFCQELDGWPAGAEVLEEIPVRSVRRRGVAVDLVLDRGHNARSQFVFTTVRGGHPAVFWQTPKAGKSARPGRGCRLAGPRGLSASPSCGTAANATATPSPASRPTSAETRSAPATTPSSTPAARRWRSSSARPSTTSRPA